ncbi:intraflagellar transport protein 57 homolog [Limulus polyphemus]|uniref:Intraflagellar transport protein 57 homolog n=1 Tax=Limulus polyphemus TaxID=6850 RepID=A0ABM1B4U5_LIMPO|nr:intraflagellar transport protein 57 homolog [Limulus polyphemus]XP_022241994.1 intraflagellar transport protein 57 homolog [Limulus polyphemus]
MGEERRREEVLEDGGPGQAFMSFVVMDDLLDKLKLLNYDKEFTREIRLKPLNRHYFALQTNPGEQFYMFTTLAAWLIRKCGKSFDTPQEYDDPNATISNIVDVLRQMGVTIDFPPSKLKQGYGEQAIFVLDRLADQALKDTQFSWKRPIYPEETEEGECAVEETLEVTSENFEEEIIGEDEDDDEEGTIMDLETLKTISSGRPLNDEIAKPEEIMESTTDSAEWKLEVERVLPQLKVTVRSDTKDWRSHLEQMHNHRKDIDESLSVTKNQLDKLYSDISHTLEKISSREKYVNSQLEQLLMEYRSVQDQLAQSKEQYRSVSGGVTERSRTLAQITEELDQIKQEMDERGSSMTDGTPLVNIRKALIRLKTEISQMDVRIGVALHTLLQAKLKEKGDLQRAANARPSVTNIDAVF